MNIKEVHLINCQSHPHSIYKFSQGLNIIVGLKDGNNHGKSVYFKMLRAAVDPNYYSRSGRKQLIRYNCTHAELIILFEDGSCGAVHVYPEQVRYHFSPDPKTIPFFSSLEPIREFSDRLGIIYLASSKFFANLLAARQDMLLVETDNSTNTSLVKLISSDNRLDNIIKQCAENSDILHTKLGPVSGIVLQLESQIKSLEYTDLSRLSDSLEVCESGIRVLEIITEVITVLHYHGDIVDSAKDYDFLLQVLDLYSVLDKEFTALTIIHSLNLELLGQFEKLSEISKYLDVEVGGLSIAAWESMSELSKGYELMLSMDIAKSDDNLIELVSICERILSVSAIATGIHTLLESINELESDIGKQEVELNQLGSAVPCVIYGEVRYVDGHCIPVSNRSTST